jgi:hypothetical protein
LEIKCGLGWVTGGGAVDAMLAYKDERIGEHVEGHGETPALAAHHELMLFQLLALFVKDCHASSVKDARVERSETEVFHVFGVLTQLVEDVALKLLLLHEVLLEALCGTQDWVVIDVAFTHDR